LRHITSSKKKARKILKKAIATDLSTGYNVYGTQIRKIKAKSWLDKWQHEKRRRKRR